MRRAVVMLLAAGVMGPGPAFGAKDAPLAPLVRLLATTDDPGVQRDVLRGMWEALRGRRGVCEPEAWPAVYRKLSASKEAEVRERVLTLSVLFGDREAKASLRKTLVDPKAEAPARQRALQALLQVRPPELLPVIRDLLSDRAMRGPALRALAAYDDPRTPALILKHYTSLTAPEKADAVATLASRPSYARALLDAVQKRQVPRGDVTPFIARQVLALKDRGLAERLNKVWGSVRTPAKQKSALLAKYKGLAAGEAFKKADRSRGRAVFAKTCATCHTLFGEGAKIGPDLTGSQRTNPEYVLTKVLDPNAVVPADFQVTTVQTSTGRVVSGVVKEETAKTLTLQTPTEVVRLAKSEVEERTKSNLSLMPEGLLAPLSDAEVRDLLAYLAGPAQVPLPKGAGGKKGGP